MSRPSKLFWFRVLHWKFLLPAGLMLWAFVEICLHAMWSLKYEPDAAFLPAMLLLGLHGFIDMQVSKESFSDERELQELQKSGRAYDWGVASLAILGTLWFSMKSFWPSIWTPVTGEEWRAIFWLLSSFGIGGRLISERMRALMPLAEDNAELVGSKPPPTTPRL